VEKKGSLAVVGTGIQIAGQTTLIARRLIEQAEKLLCLVADDATDHWLKSLNETAESLSRFYEPGKPRIRTYSEMVEATLCYVRQGLNVCLAAYGHPGVFSYVGHESVRRARLEGFAAQMSPGVSAEDCLFADLGIDPGASGCHSFGATNFLIYDRRFDPNVPLILWQVGVIGRADYVADPTTCGQGLSVLMDSLLRHYDSEHEIIVYRAALIPMGEPVVQRIALKELGTARIETMATLVVPPRAPSRPNPGIVARLGIQFSFPTAQG